jgi:iron-sulfur cluster protein
MSEVTPFPQRLAAALADERLAANLLAFQRSWRPSRDAAFAELAALGDTFDAARGRLRAAKDAVLADPTAAIQQFVDRATAAGAVVHHAETGHDARAIIESLLRSHGARLVVKGKSMVAEEIFLNRHLEAAGFTVVETDLGEWIIQLAGELPSHMVIPAIHKNRAQVAALFERTLGERPPHDDIAGLVRLAREALRSAFLRADAGLIGANALVADTGSVVLVTNEGNGDLVATLPRLTIVLAGWDKLVPTLGDVATQLRLLARSATAQPVTSFTTLITGAEPGRELHIVLLDNGRTAMWRDRGARDALRCIRCAACADVCPPYQVVGGHAFGYVYSGAIGLVNTRFHHGAAAAQGPLSLCVSCNACATVCPADIPLPRQILAARAAVAREHPPALSKRFILGLWARPRLFDVALRAVALASAIPGRWRRALLPADQRWRTPPVPSRRPAGDRLLGRTFSPARRSPWATAATRGRTVTLFLQCLADRFMPSVVFDTIRILRRCGFRVVVPPTQHCCGLAHLDSGDLERARRLARQTVVALEIQADYVVTVGTSCAVAIAHEYETIFAGAASWQRRAAALAARTFDLVSFLDRVVDPPHLPKRDRQVAWRPFCQRTNVLGRPEAGARLLDRAGYHVVALTESEVCCGFGGAVALDHPAVSRGIARRALEAMSECRASVIATDNPGCHLHLAGALDAARMAVDLRHIATLLAESLTSATIRP